MSTAKTNLNNSQLSNEFSDNEAMSTEDNRPIESKMNTRNSKANSIKTNESQQPNPSTQTTSNLQNLLNPALIPLINNLMLNMQNNAANSSYSNVVVRGNTANNPYQTFYTESKQNSHYRTAINPEQPSQSTEDTSSKLITLKFKSNTNFNSNFKNYFSLQKEIKRCKPNAKIINAYISNQEELIIKVNSQLEESKLKSEWPNDAFTSGIELINKKIKFYLALKNVDLDFDITDQETLNYMTNEYNITSLMRLVKKSTNSPLRIIKAIVADKNSYDSIIKEGKIKLGYTSIKVTPWNFGEQSDQCFNCLKFGHSSKSCKAPPCCLRCAENHNFKECNMKDETRLKCANCKGNHAACSKSCPVLTNRNSKKKSKSESIINPRPTLQQPSSKHQQPDPNLANHLNEQIRSTTMKFLHLIIDILTNFQTIQETIFETKEPILQLINKYFDQSFNAEIEGKLSQLRTTNEVSDDDDYEGSDDE